jgi:hypothetical protein
MALVTTYDAKQVVIAAAGIQLTGYTDGEFLNIAASSDDYGFSNGADGSVTRFPLNDSTHTVTVTLQQTSPSNSTLNGLRGAVFPFSVTDLNGSEVFVGTGWIQRSPDIADARESGSRAWTLLVVADVKEYGGANLTPIGF